MAFDIVTPDYPLPASRRRLALTQAVRTPNDLREGLHMAYDTVCEVLYFLPHADCIRPAGSVGYRASLVRRRRRRSREWALAIAWDPPSGDTYRIAVHRSFDSAR